jgi:hypothetical protein
MARSTTGIADHAASTAAGGRRQRFATLKAAECHVEPIVPAGKHRFVRLRLRRGARDS